MKFSVFFVLLTLAVNLKTIASPCEKVNLSEHFQKVFDQKDMGWCYAFTAADLVSYKFREILQGKSISPMHLAILQNSSFEDRFNRDNGGSVKDTIRLATSRYVTGDRSGFHSGVCLSLVDEAISGFQPNRSPRQQFNQIWQLKNKYDQTLVSKDRKSYLEYLESLIKDNSPLKYIDSNRLEQLLKFSDNRNIGIEFINLFCPAEGRFVAPQVAYPVSYFVGDEISLPQKNGPSLVVPIKSSVQVMAAIHDQLTRNNVVGINYQAGFLRYENAENQPGDFHASTVIGREMIRGVCHIIVRNSWGECKTQDGKYKYSKNVSRCQSGNLWIPENTLLKYLNGITYIKSE